MFCGSGRGQSYPAVLHSEARVETSLKRGADGTFAAVSWDEALADIASKITATAPEKVAMFQDGRNTHDYFTQRFMSAIGSPNYFGDTVFNDMDILSVINSVFGVCPAPDPGESRYIVLFDKSYYEGIRPVEAGEIIYARQNGGKVVVVDPRMIDYCSIADEWIPVRPGFDLAFLLGVAGYIAANEGYDAAFGEANGLGFGEFVEGAKQHTPEWASELCGIPAEKIAAMADCVLPVMTYLECEGIVKMVAAKQTVATLRTKVAETVFPETRTVAEVMRDLGKACGQDKYFTFTLEEYNEALCNGYGISYDHLRTDGLIVMENVKLEYGSPMYIMTQSHKIEFASEACEAAGLGLTPEWLEPEVTGTVQVTARVTERIYPEVVYLPPHYGSQSEAMGQAFGFGACARTLIPRAEEPATGAAMNHEVTVRVRRVNA